MFTPRLLTLSDDDIAAYIELRLTMLTETPWAYLATPEDDIGCDPRKLKIELAKPDNVIFVVDNPGNEPDRRSPTTSTKVRPSLGIIASAGVVRDSHAKTAHKAIIWGVYVSQTFRRRGLGRAVMLSAIDAARGWPGIDRLTLSASSNSPEAIGLYESMGFRRWGEELDAMRMDGASYDEVHLSKRL